MNAMQVKERSKERRRSRLTLYPFLSIIMDSAIHVKKFFCLQTVSKSDGDDDNGAHIRRSWSFSLQLAVLQDSLGDSRSFGVRKSCVCLLERGTCGRRAIELH